MTTSGDTSTQTTSSPTSSGATGHWVLVLVVLALICMLMRLSNLMAMPIFGDEAIYLRWSQLIRGEGLSAGAVGGLNPWISLADPKPPLHFWLIALFYNWSDNPLVVARTISVWAGVLSVPLIFLVCHELGDLLRRPADRSPAAAPWFATGRVTGILAALLLIFSPFLSFYARLGTADALFVAESLLIVWLSLRWARLATATPNAASARRAWITAAFLGLGIASALMTRQGLSYTLSLFPAFAWIAHFLLRRRPIADAETPASRSTRRILLLSAAQLASAALIAAACWAPYLTAELAPRALENKRDRLNDRTATLAPGDTLAEIKRRILYQEKFTERNSTLATAARNVRLTFIPGTNERGATDSGWFFHYLTPFVYLASLAGLLYLALRRQWPVLFLLLVWISLAMGPVLILGNVIFSRYVLAGVPPFLIAAGFLVGDLVGILFSKYERKPALPWTATILLFASLLLPGLLELGRQASRWTRQTLTARDNYQYISGWTAGSATDKAIRWVRQTATAGPVVLITDNGWGTPSDALWVYLSGHPNIQLYYTDRDRILDPVPGPPSADVWLRPNKWLFPPYEKTTLDPDVPILFITREGASPVIERLREANPGIKQLGVFRGVVDPRTGQGDPEGSVSLFQLPQPLD